MTRFEHLQLDRRDDGIAIVTIDRPDSLNALNEQVLEELIGATSELDGDADLRAVIVTGTGRAFVAGADIASMKEMSAQQADEFGRLGHRAMNQLEQLPVPTLAAVNGFALGGGLELALACDLIYLSENARIGLPEVGLGIIPGFGGTQRLGRLVGWQQARRIVFTGTQLTADEARSIGLCVDVLAADSFLDDVLDVATTIADQGPVAVRKAKEVMQRGADETLQEGNQREIDAFTDLWNTRDRAEGMDAFIDKRSPDFEGR